MTTISASRQHHQQIKEITLIKQIGKEHALAKSKIKFRYKTLENPFVISFEHALTSNPPPSASRMALSWARQRRGAWCDHLRSWCWHCDHCQSRWSSLARTRPPQSFVFHDDFLGYVAPFILSITISWIFFYRSTISPSQSWCHHRSTWILKEHVAALQWDVSAAKGEVEENIDTWKGSEKIEVNYVVSRDDINGKKMKWSSSSEEFLSWLLNIDYGIWKTSLLNYKFLVKLVVEVVE